MMSVLRKLTFRRQRDQKPQEVHAFVEDGQLNLIIHNKGANTTKSVHYVVDTANSVELLQTLASSPDLKQAVK